MKQKLSSLFVLGAVMALGSQAALAAPDWSKVPTKTIPVIHPAVSPLEWVQSRDHSGASGLKKGENCAGCHYDGGKLDIDLKRLAGKEMEPKGAPKTMTYPVGVQAAYDATNLYVRLTFKAPAGGFDHSDKDNEVKATVMFPNDKVPLAEQAGCWGACHKDARTMPGADDKKTKYVTSGAMDLMQWKSGGGGKAVDGTVTDKRNMEGGKAGVTERAYSFWKQARAVGLGARIMLVKGDARNTGPRLSRTFPDSTGRTDRKANAAGEVPVWLLNTLILKDSLAADLERTAAGPGYIHFPDWLGQWFYDELAAETRTAKGWQNMSNDRNEAFDLCVYNHAAMLLVRGDAINWNKPPAWADPTRSAVGIALIGDGEPAPLAPQPKPAAPKPRPVRRDSGSWGL